MEADRDGAIRISDFRRSSVLLPQVAGSISDTQAPFIRDALEAGPLSTPGMKISKADDMHAFGVLAWEVVDPPFLWFDSFTQGYAAAVCRRIPTAISRWDNHDSRLCARLVAST